MQKVSLWPPACNILQVGRAKRPKRVSHPPKTPNLPPPRGRLTHRQRKKKYFIHCHYFLLSSYSIALLTWLFSAVPPPTLLFILVIQKAILPLLCLFLTSFAPTVPCLLVAHFAWYFLSFLFPHCLVVSLLCFFFSLILTFSLFFFFILFLQFSLPTILEWIVV